MTKEYLEIVFYMVVKNEKIELTQPIYDLEYKNVQDGIAEVVNELRHSIDTTAFSKGSTINDKLIELGLFDWYRKNEYVILLNDPVKLFEELNKNDDCKEESRD